MLTLTMGIPAAGKTTYARQQAVLTGVTHICFDCLRIDHTVDLATHLQRLEDDAVRHVTDGYDVIIDACAVQAYQRRRWRGIATRAHVPARLVIVRCPLSVAMARNASRREPVPEHVMRRYGEQMQHAEHDVITERWDSIETVGTVGDGPAASRSVMLQTSQDW